MADPRDAYRRMQGYTGRPGYTGEAHNPIRWGGTAGQAVDGWIQPGTSGADRDVNRYRGMGEAAQQAAGPTVDQTRSDKTRGLQMGSLAGLQRVASGDDSQALALGRQQAAQAANAQTSMAASTRGGAMARAAAGRAANRNAARSEMEIGNMARAGQAQEMANARAQLMQGSSQMRGQDLGLATSDAQLAAQQRALNEQQQQAYERMGWDTQNAEMMAGSEVQRQQWEGALSRRQARAAKNQQDFERGLWLTTTAASAFTGGMGGMGSDERMKVPVGSLARLMR